MRRREFLGVLGGVAAGWPLAARAQQAAKLPTVGFLGPTTPSSQSQHVAAFVQRLRELGLIEGRDVAIVVRWAEGRDERYAQIANTCRMPLGQASGFPQADPGGRVNPRF
jgi:putative ABC transport system substrate-binding protein